MLSRAAASAATVSVAVTASVRPPPVTVTVFSIVPSTLGSAKLLTRVS